MQSFLLAESHQLQYMERTSSLLGEILQCLLSTTLKRERSRFYSPQSHLPLYTICFYLFVSDLSIYKTGISILPSLIKCFELCHGKKMCYRKQSYCADRMQLQSFQKMGLLWVMNAT